jgi:hypothetical protein
MKIYITENIDKAIDGYYMIPIIYGKIDVSTIPNNIGEKIVAIDALDSIPYNLFDEFLSLVLLKMRMGCELILGGTELSIVAQDIINNKIDSQKFNEVIFNKRGVYSVKNIIDKLCANNLTILDVNIKGYHYELTAVRPANKN